MNIHFQQVERKSQLFSHLFVAFAAAVTVLILALSIVRNFETHWSVPSVSIQTAQIEQSMPATIPVPLPPAEATTANSTPEPNWNAMSMVIPRAIPAPTPSVP